MFYSLSTEQWLLAALVVVLVLVLVVMPIFTNKKKQQSISNLHSSLKVGDKIMTIGGIIGYIVAIKNTSAVDKELLIETGEGDNKTTMLIDIKGLFAVINPPSVIPAQTADGNNTNNSSIEVFEEETPAVEAYAPAEEPTPSDEVVATVAIVEETETAPEAVEPATEEPAVEKVSAKTTAPKKTTATKSTTTKSTGTKSTSSKTSTKKPIEKK